jgi:LysR family transcriptional regulator for metE and metH
VNDLDLRDLRLVAAIDQHGGVTKASAVLHLTQSALSHQLADLERRLGTAVFARVGRRLVLTPAGERLREAARTILPSVAAATAEVRGIAEQREAVLRFSTECYTCYHWLPPLLKEYQRSYPRVELRIVADVTRRPLPALLKGELDVGILSTPVRDRRVTCSPLFTDELVAVVAPNHPWAKMRSVTPEAFADEHVILYSMARNESTLISRILDPADVKPRQVSHVELTEAILELIKAGLGVGFLAQWAVAPHVRNGSLVAVRVSHPATERQWSAAVRRQAADQPHITAFLALLRHGLTDRRGAALKLVQA